MGFESFHPAINLLYFTAVIAGTLCFRQPVFLAISFAGAFAYSVRRGGKRGLIFDLCLLPLIGVFALFYAGYHHFGVTVLRRNFIGNNMTLESLLCGLTLGTVAAAVMMWLSCVFSVFTADKVVYLFGRVSPKASLFLAVTLRMVPRVKAQAGKIHTARRGIGRGVDQGTPLRRLVNGCRILSMVLTWLLEALVGVAASMGSRGYGLKGRTAFSIYRFDNRDRGLVIGMSACLTLTLMGVLLGQTAVTFDPRLLFNPITAMSFLFYAGYLALCLLGPGVELYGQWQFSRRRRRA